MEKICVIATMDFVHRDSGKYLKNKVYHVDDNKVNRAILFTGYFRLFEDTEFKNVVEVKEEKTTHKTKEFKGNKKTK